LSTQLAGKIHELMQRAKNLRNNVAKYHTHATVSMKGYGDSRVLETHFQIYTNLRNDIIKLFHSDTTVNSLLSLSPEDRFELSDLVILIAGLDQIIGFLEGKQVDVLGTRIRKFPVQEKELDILPSTTRLLLLEAIGEYDYNHSYACCCICGLTFESLVKEGCKKNNLPYEGLANGIKALKEAEVIKEDLHKSLMDLEKYYRDKISAHLTSVVATDEKARLFLSSLLSLGKAIFAT
jgi:hypothetical protein